MDSVRYPEYEDPTNVVDHEETVDCDNCTEDPTSPLVPMLSNQGQFRPMGPPTSFLEMLPPFLLAQILADLHPQLLAQIPPSILALLPPSSILAMEW